MISLLHIWNEAATASALELVMVATSTAAVVALHLWLSKLFAGRTSATGDPPPATSDGIAELRALRRQRRLTARRQAG
jgi:hypothetical protein